MPTKMPRQTWTLIILLTALSICGCMEQRQYQPYNSDYNKEYVESTTLPPFSTLPSTELNQYMNDNSKITIGLWSFDKLSNQNPNDYTTLSTYTPKIRLNDITVVEDMANAERQFDNLCAMLPEYKCYLSDPASDTTKEKYGLIYKKAILLDIKPIASNALDNNPLWLTFVYNNWTFNLVAAHTTQTKTDIELQTLDYILNGASFKRDTILIGNLNAGCVYVKQQLPFDKWIWVVKDSDNTITDIKDNKGCPLDRIIINNRSANHLVEYHIIKSVTPSQSGHYMISAVFRTDIP